MTRKATVSTIGVVAALAGGGAAIAGAASGGDDSGNEQPITGAALRRASDVALGAVPGGKVTATEVNDEEGAYEVEVTKPDRTQVDVHINRDFTIINSQADREEDR